MELGDALAMFLKRCDMVRVHGKDAVYSYRDSLFSLADALKELEPKAGNRTKEISEFLLMIEVSLCGENSDADRAAIQLYEILCGRKAA